MPYLNHVFLVVLTSFVFCCGRDGNALEPNQTRADAIARLPDIGEELPAWADKRIKYLPTQFMSFDGHTAPGGYWNGCEIIFLLNEDDQTIKTIITRDVGFYTPEGFSMCHSFDDYLAQVATTAFWYYDDWNYICYMPSGWQAYFEPRNEREMTFMYLYKGEHPF